MNITNIRKFSFNGYEIFAIRRIAGIMSEYEKEEDTELAIGFYKDSILIERQDDEDGNDFDPLYEQVGDEIVVNYLGISEDEMRLYCQAHYLTALSKATALGCGNSIFVRGVHDICLDSDNLEFEVHIDGLKELNQWLCPSLLKV